MSLEPVQPPDAASVAAVETELERLRRYLEVSQAPLEAAELEMQVVQGQQVAANSEVANEFFIHHSGLTACIYFSHSSCLCVEQS
jgi:hypothetical protein